MVLGFFAISLYSGIVSYYDFQTRNAGDLTIFMQALASTVHGAPTPFYESYDCMVKDRCSFLLVHPSLVLYVVAPIYAIAPSPIPLFAIQSAAVALAAVPLYLLTRDVTRSWPKGLLAAALFLLWAPTLSGEAFSFHMESFLPLELFGVAWLWQTGRYRSGLLLVLLSFLTIEVAPLFTVLIGVFFLLPGIEETLLSRWRRWRTRGVVSVRTAGIVARGIRFVRRAYQRTGVRYTLWLMGISIVAYVLLFLFMNVWGAHLLDVPAPPRQPGLAGIFYDSSSPVTQSIATILHSSQTVHTLDFWLLLYALLAFIPLLSPRALILSAPWIGWTFLTDSDRYVQLGTQYTLVAAVPLFLGLAYGLQRVPLGRSPSSDAAPDADRTRLSPSVTPVRMPRRPPRGLRAFWTAAISAVIIANVVLLPINPLLSDLRVQLGEPFQQEYQDHSLAVAPGLSWAQQLAGIVPPAATVTAPPQIFDLIANDPHAYVLLGRSMENLTAILPLNLTRGPDDVLLYAGFLPSIGPNLSANFSNPALYGPRGFVASTALGALMLYQRAYTGVAEFFGPVLAPASETYYPDNGLAAGKAGEIRSNASAPNDLAITTVPGSHRAGEVWTGPGVLLLPGAYTVSLLAAATGPGVGVASAPPFLQVRIQGFAPPLINTSVPASDFTPGQWSTLSFQVSTSIPLLDLNVEGYLLNGKVGLSVGEVTITPTDPALQG